MVLRIHSSLAFTQVKRGVDRSQSRLQVSLERISTGLRMNHSKDDVAGLAISERLSARMRGALASIQNLNAGISLFQVVDGALNESTQAVLRMRELAVAAASETLSDRERAAMDVEFQLLSAQLDSIAEETNFNGIKLLGGDHQELALHIGGNANDSFRVKLDCVTATELGRQARYTTERRGVFISDVSTEDLKINGVTIRASVDQDDLISYSFSRGSSIAKAEAINAATPFTGVRAIVGHNVIRGFEPVRAVNLDPQNFFKVNGHPVTGVAVADKDSTGVLVQHINAGFEETGVKAEVDSFGHLILTAEDGRNITVEYGSAVVRDAIRLIDFNGDPINLVDTVDPVVTTLDGDIDTVSFVGTGSYDGAYELVGDVTINGVTSTDTTGGFPKPRDHVDFVLEVVNPGNLNQATFRYKEQVIGDQGIDSIAEDYQFNARGNITSSSEDKVTESAVAYYNEGSNRRFTLTVTKNGLPSASDTVNDLPEFTVSMQNLDEPTDTAVSGPFVAQLGQPVDLGFNAFVDFPVASKHALRPNGSTMSFKQKLVQTATGADHSYTDRPQFRTWDGDRTTHFTYTVLTEGHAGGAAAIATGANTPAAVIRVTANTPSLGTTESIDVPLDAVNQDITYKGMKTRFFRQLGTVTPGTSITGSYDGDFKADDSLYVGTEDRTYTVTMLDDGPINNSSALRARVRVYDDINDPPLQDYAINDLRSGQEFNLGTGIHFEGAVFDLTASESVVDPSPVGSPNIVAYHADHF